MRKLILSFLLLGLFACNQSQTEATTQSAIMAEKMPIKSAKNVILMIGDGMGLTQISAGLYSNNNFLNLERFPYVGLHKSYSSDDLVTDSAAGATALSAGVKTYNAAIGVDKDGKPVETILEQAEKKGMATGMVATSTIVHATPGSFIAHIKHRDMYEEIAADFLNTDIDFFVGGGQKYFNRRTKDERNLVEELEKKGYVMKDFRGEDIKTMTVDFSKKFAYFTADDSPLPAQQGRDYLPAASRLATTYLSKQGDKGFFLMVEGSQIDWGSHSNKADYIIAEMIDFDKAIGEMLKFAEEDGETLVIVTADHETGGFAINPGSTWDTIIPGFTTTHHTAALIPVFAYGPGSELFSGIYENTAIFDKMQAALGFSKTKAARD